ncbi:MTAP family purine nucleoside phosphorylase [Alkaliphilus serpentinus]|uniref:MTAP family purine nucleoside phosphorylase n=1 Tax=Alkaliphilus serpentinus TaxID=1482731 RepID=UPI0018658962|nr:MTAP family purine nucleoside phosphorylase [Alkaliphilus serpentinus]
MKVGIIGSTGFEFYRICDSYIEKEIIVDLESIKYLSGDFHGIDIYFFVRNIRKGACPPHSVDYLRIMKAMQLLQVNSILATSVVGSLRPEYKPGDHIIIDQFLDFTKYRIFTVYNKDEFAFVDFTYPYCNSLRQVLANSCEKIGVDYKESGCYVGVDGPRFETAAEVKAYSILGGDVVGMTNIPEVILARELGLCYATIALIVNYGAGIEGNLVLRKDCREEVNKHIDKTVDIIRNALSNIRNREYCDCYLKADDIITN